MKTGKCLYSNTVLRVVVWCCKKDKINWTFSYESFTCSRHACIPLLSLHKNCFALRLWLSTSLGRFRMFNFAHHTPNLVMPSQERHYTTPRTLLGMVLTPINWPNCSQNTIPHPSLSFMASPVHHLHSINNNMQTMYNRSFWPFLEIWSLVFLHLVLLKVLC